MMRPDVYARRAEDALHECTDPAAPQVVKDDALKKAQTFALLSIAAAISAEIARPA